MEKTLQPDLLGNLYALRAGLSVISQGGDLLIDNRTKFEASGIDAIRKFIDKYQHRYELEEYSVQQKISNRYTVINYPYLSANSTYFAANGGPYLGFYAYMYKAAYNNSYASSDKEFYPLATTHTDIDYTQYREIAEAFNLSQSEYSSNMNKWTNYLREREKEFELTCLYWFCTDESVKHFNTIVDNANKFIADLKKKSNFFNKYKIIHFEKDLESLKAIFPVLDHLKKIRTPLLSANSNIKQNCSELLNLMQKLYSHILDVRDWQYLDLVIFYLETRRAENVKEALLLVDREMQTQRIENAIQQATAQICNTLAIGFTLLQQTVENSYRALSAQIASSTAAISSQMAGLTSAVNMNNALRAKANISSEQLMNDVQALRNYIVK